MARKLGGQPQESVGHLGVYLQRRDPRRYVQGVLVHHRLEAVVGSLLNSRFCVCESASLLFRPWFTRGQLKNCRLQVVLAEVPTS